MASAPDLRKAFKAVSDSMLAEFSRLEEMPHPTGKGTAREEVLRQFLKRHLPARFGVGAGQIAHWANVISTQCDVVLYDCLNTPRLMPYPEHSIFPAEAVFAAIEVKSVLTSETLRNGFEKALSAHRASMDPDPFSEDAIPSIIDVNGPFTAVFAFKSDRSLEAIRDQIEREWPNKDGTIEQRPPLVVVLNEGTVGSPIPRMSNPKLGDHLHIRRTGDLTLLRFFMHLLAELQATRLSDFHLLPYLQVPEIIDGRRVRQRLYRSTLDGQIRYRRINKRGIDKIVRSCEGQKPFRYSGYVAAGAALEIPFVIDGRPQERPALLYNPRNLQLLSVLKDGRAFNDDGPLALVTVDGTAYIVDKGALEPEDFEDPPDPRLAALF